MCAIEVHKILGPIQKRRKKIMRGGGEEQIKNLMINFFFQL